MLLLVDLSVFQGQVPVDKCMLDLIVEGCARKWTPLTLVMNCPVFDRLLLSGRNNNQIGVISLSDETSFFNVKQLSRGMAHFFNDHLIKKNALVAQLKHGLQAVFDEGAARGGFEIIGVVFLV